MQTTTIRAFLEFLYQTYKDDGKASDELKKYLRDYRDGFTISLETLNQLLQDVGHMLNIMMMRTAASREQVARFAQTSPLPLILLTKDKNGLAWIEWQGKQYRILWFHPEKTNETLSDTLPFEEFFEEPQGFPLFLLSPQEEMFGAEGEVIPGTEASRPIYRFLRLMRPERKEIILLYIYAIFNGLVALSLPLGIQAIIVFLMGAQLSFSLILLIGLVLLGTLASGFLQIMQIWIVEAIQQRLFARAAFEFAHRIPRLRLDALTGIYPPELINRFFDILSVQKGIPKILIDFSTALLQILFGLILLSFYHPVFLFLGLFLFLLLVFAIRLTGPKAMIASLYESKYKYEVAYWLEELGRSMSIFKLAGNTNLPMEKTDHLVSSYMYYRKKRFKVIVTQNWYFVAFKMMITASLLILGGTLVVEQQINIGQFVAAEIVILLILSSIEKFISGLENVYDVLTASEKLGAVTDIPMERRHGVRCQDLMVEKGIALEVKNLSYLSPVSGTPILDQVQFRIEKGQKVVLMGKNGSGKTTLLTLIAGMFENCEGQIFFNDMPLRNIDLYSLHTVVSENLAQELIFKGTVYENIAVGRPEVGLNEVMEAAKAVGLESFLQKLPDGYDTVLIPDDRSLPSGELRKITLARCLAEHPKLLLLEDFLGVYGGAEKRRIIHTLTHEMPDCTLLAVTNDLDFAQACDLVIFMDKGRIVAMGPLEEVQKNEVFNRIYG
jgi:ABC-type bacteriocin/lantibiotic exporter with double-glycine peptidase domain